MVYANSVSETGGAASTPLVALDSTFDDEVANAPGALALSASEIALAARELDGAPPLEALLWAAARFAPRLAFATGFGPEGCVLVDLIGRHELPVDVFTLDTGLLFVETRQLWRRLESRYGLTIRAVRPELSLERQAALHGDSLWARHPDRCCELRKVRPLRAALAGHQAWIAAIRRDQTAARAAAQVVEEDRAFGLVKVNPLVGWSSEQVWEHLREHRVPTSTLHERGYASVGCWPCTTPVAAGEDPRAGRWRGQAKTECGLHLRSIVGADDHGDAQRGAPREGNDSSPLVVIGGLSR
ncbi:MAG TPA: phosphoadenylyl-sulfate reductase [Thermoanaerobaculia bacterium]|nr:phosphoadenylyl-sulfate reductase [Thermoanaerobaculia bacterium]